MENKLTLKDAAALLEENGFKLTLSVEVSTRMPGIISETELGHQMIGYDNESLCGHIIGMYVDTRFISHDAYGDFYVASNAKEYEEAIFCIASEILAGNTPEKIIEARNYIYV